MLAVPVSGVQERRGRVSPEIVQNRDVRRHEDIALTASAMGRPRDLRSNRPGYPFGEPSARILTRKRCSTGITTHLLTLMISEPDPKKNLKDRGPAEQP